MAADLRAPTPTAAAELVAPKTLDCLDLLAAQAGALRRRVVDLLDACSQRLDRNAQRLSRPDVRLREHAQRLGLLAHQLASLLPREAAQRRVRLKQSDADLRRASARYLAARADRLESMSARLVALDPQRVLARGYAWLVDSVSNRAVTSVEQVTSGSLLQAVLADGVVGALVTDVAKTPAIPKPLPH